MLLPGQDKGVSHKADKNQSAEPIDNEECGKKGSDPPAKRRPVPTHLVLEGGISKRQTRVQGHNGTDCTPALGAKPPVHIQGTDDEKANRCHLVGGREERRNLRRRNLQDGAGRHNSGFFYKESHRRMEWKSQNPVAMINVPSQQGWQGSMQQVYDAQNIHGDTTRGMSSVLQPTMEWPNPSTSMDPRPLVTHSDSMAQMYPCDPRIPRALTKPRPSIVQSTLTPKTGALDQVAQTDCADQANIADLPGPTLSTKCLNPSPQRNPAHSRNRVDPIPTMSQPGTRLQADWSDARLLKNISGPKGQVELSDSRVQMIQPDQSNKMGCSELYLQNGWIGPRLPKDCSDAKLTLYESDPTAPAISCRPQTEHLLSQPVTLGLPYNIDHRLSLSSYTTEVSTLAQKPRVHSKSAYNIGEVSLHAGRTLLPHHLTPDLGSSPDLHSHTTNTAEHRTRHHSEMTTPAHASSITGNRTVHYDYSRGGRYLQECPLPEHPVGHISNTGHLSNELKSAPSHEPEASIHSLNKQEVFTYGHNSAINISDPKNASMLHHSNITLNSSDTGTGRVLYDARATRLQSKEQDEVKGHTRHILEKETVHPTTQKTFLLYTNNVASRERNHLSLGPRLPPSIIARSHYTQVPKGSLH